MATHTVLQPQDGRTIAISSGFSARRLRELPEGCAFSTPFVEHVGSDISVARAFHDADSAVEPR